MIRLKIFIPVFLLLVLLICFAVFRLDGWVRAELEEGISAITGTKTDISNVNISLRDSSLTIGRLEIASSDDEMKNAVEFENLVLEFEILPLLKKRLKVKEFSIRGVALGSRRTHSGKLVRHPEGPSWVSVKTDKAMAALKKEVKSLPVAKLMDFDVPVETREILDRLSLKSVEAFKAAIASAEQMRGQWTLKLQQFRDFNEYERRISEAKKFSQNPPENPEGLVEALKLMRENYDFFLGEKKRAQSLVNDVDIDWRRIQKSYDAGVSALTADYEAAKRMVSFDGLNLNNLSRMIFGSVWIDRMETVLRYHSILRQLMVSSSEHEDKSLEVTPRKRGRDIHFVDQSDPPGFILVKSEFTLKGVSDKASNGPTEQYVVSLSDINSSPKRYGKPSEVNFKFRLGENSGDKIIFKSVWDYTTSVLRDRFNLVAEDLNAGSWDVGVPSVLPLKILTGKARCETELKFEGDQLTWSARVNFKDVTWNLSELSTQGVVAPVFHDVLSKAKDFDLSMELKSKGDALELSWVSDFDQSLKNGIDLAVQRRLADFQQKLRHEIENQVDAYQKAALLQQAEFQNDVKAKIDGYVTKASNSADETAKALDVLKKKNQGRAVDYFKKNLPRPEVP
jgi:uncharacterized protein (TIGR03545 family)